MLFEFIGQFHVLQSFFITLEDLDGIPAQVFRIHLILDGFLDMGDGMLHAAGKYVRQLGGLAGLGSIQAGLDGVLGSLTLQCADLNDLYTQFVGQFLHVDLVAVFLDKVHHVHCHDYRQSDLQQLCGKVQVAFDVGAVHDVEDDVGFFFHQIVSGYDFFQGVRT